MPFALRPDEVTEIAELLRRRHKAMPWTQDALLAVIAAPRYPIDVYWAAIGLRDCGTARCVPALKALATNPKQDTKAVAILTIAQVAGAAETPYYAQCLLDPAYRMKGFALWAIGETGDARALEAVHAYAKKRRRQIIDAGHDPLEQREIVAYFHRALGVQATQELFSTQYAWLREALAASLQRMHDLPRARYLARVPGLEAVLGISPG
jgi:hypothetical protein